MQPSASYTEGVEGPQRENIRPFNDAGIGAGFSGTVFPEGTKWATVDETC